MCGIFASKNLIGLSQLAKQNQHRGQLSWSLCKFDGKNRPLQYAGPSIFPRNIPALVPESNSNSEYFIGHVRASTDSQTEELKQPVTIGDNLLWHNGLLLDKCVENLSKKYQVPFGLNRWDSYLLLQHLLHRGDMKELQGSFSCLYWNNDLRKLFVFRNELSPMFYGDDLSFSSVPVSRATQELPANAMFEVPIANGNNRLTKVLNSESYTGRGLYYGLNA